MRYAIVALHLVLAAPAAAQVTIAETSDVALQSFGYGRAGLGLDENGDDQVCFQAPGAGAKYRLGNECEIYVEPGLRLRLGEAEGPRLTLEGRLSIYSGPVNDFDTTFVWVEEAFAALEGVFSGPLTGGELWAGQRFYKRQDVHINDFYWWDMSGLGAGIDGYELGPGALALAYFARSGTDLEDELLDAPGYHRIDARLQEIGLSERWSLTLGADLRFPAEAEGAEEALGTLATMAFTRSETFGGAATLAVQAGLGAGATLANVSDPDAERGELATRAVATTTFNLAEGVVGQTVALAEWRGEGREWVSAGLRPVFELSDPIHLAVEGGVDHVWDAGGEARTLGKLTAALEWKPAGGAFFDRPVARAFVTTAAWNDGADEAGIAPDLDGRTGVTVGVQVEHWW